MAPRCGDESGPPAIFPETAAVTGVFVSCLPDNKISCLNIARAMSTEKSGITVNIVFKETDLPLFQDDFTQLSEQFGANRLNLIPMKAESPAYYLRDVSVVSSSSNKTVLDATPYANGRVTGRETTETIARECRASFETNYQNLDSFRRVKDLLRADPVSVVRERFPSMDEETILSIAGNLSSPDGLDKFAITEFIPDELDRGSLMGGNFAGLPGGSIAVGKSPTRNLNREVISSMSRGQPVLEVEIPDLEVGHIDEVFKIIPDAGPCGYAVIRASPNKAKSFLESRAPSERFGKLSGLEAIKKMFDPGPIKDLHERRMELAAHYRAQGIAPQTQADYQQLEREFTVATRNDVNVSQILGDSTLMNKWNEFQEAINRGTDQIINEINRTRSPACSPRLIDLPTFFTESGSLAIANPVNGLQINGQYFRSRAHQELVNSSDFTSEYPHYEALDQFIDQQLAPSFGSHLRTIDTGQYDIGGGNLHCATMNFSAACIP